MFDPLLELKRRRMLGVPQVQGNIIPPDVGPDIQAQSPVAPAPMVMQPMQPQADGSNFGGLAELGAMRGMNLLMKKLRPEQGANVSALAKTPVLSRLFRR